ncbi:MAG: biopolymer transporter ExbD [Phycisphaera sp.]|nr:biopolymer transporter ExbD [Phycisphaera sp.]
MKIKRKTFSADVPSMAMGDIIFTLLIFFVILARAQDDSHLKWEPAKSPDVDQAKHALASVVIDVNNKLYLNGQPIGVSQLAGALKERLGNAPAGERTVLLKVHREATAQFFEPVIEAISEAGGDLLHVLEQERDDKKQARAP